MFLVICNILENVIRILFDALQSDAEEFLPHIFFQLKVKYGSMERNGLVV